VPKVTISFNLPEERYEHENAIRGADWRNIVYELTVFLRNKLKYGHEYKSADEALEDVRKTLWDECNSNHLDPWEG
jgi:hypothetical protein